MKKIRWRCSGPKKRLSFKAPPRTQVCYDKRRARSLTGHERGTAELSWLLTQRTTEILTPHYLTRERQTRLDEKLSSVTSTGARQARHERRKQKSATYIPLLRQQKNKKQGVALTTRMPLPEHVVAAPSVRGPRSAFSPPRWTLTRSFPGCAVAGDDAMMPSAFYLWWKKNSEKRGTPNFHSSLQYSINQCNTLVLLPVPGVHMIILKLLHCTASMYSWPLYWPFKISIPLFWNILKNLAENSKPFVIHTGTEWGFPNKAVSIRQYPELIRRSKSLDGTVELRY